MDPLIVRARIPALLLVLAAVLAPTAARAQEAEAVADLPPGVSHIGGALAGVAVEGTAARDAQAAYDLVAARRATATAAIATAQVELANLAALDVSLTDEIAARTDDRKAANVRLAVARRAVQQAAASAYVTSAASSDMTRVLDPASTVDVGSVQVLSDVVEEDRAAEQDAARRALDAASAAIDDAQDDRDTVRARQLVVEEARRTAEVDLVTSTIELGDRLFDLGQARATSRVRGLDFTLVALDAYVTAAESVPECGLRWWALAGISRVEGRHGTHGGAELGADGQVSRPIIGIPLNGLNDTAAIGDTDGGRLDGDPAVDRAVGPMQFIPSTWERWATDGDGDGDTDPQNLYDAAASAAAYLCNGRRMVDEAALRAGYFSYNHSELYVETVLGYAVGYRDYRIPPPPPEPPVPPTVPPSV